MAELTAEESDAREYLVELQRLRKQIQQAPAKRTPPQKPAPTPSPSPPQRPSQAFYPAATNDANVEQFIRADFGCAYPGDVSCYTGYFAENFQQGQVQWQN
jgi:hypothetical protein